MDSTIFVLPTPLGPIKTLIPGARCTSACAYERKPVSESCEIYTGILTETRWWMAHAIHHEICLVRVWQSNRHHQVAILVLIVFIQFLLAGQHGWLWRAGEGEANEISVEGVQAFGQERWVEGNHDVFAAQSSNNGFFCLCVFAGASVQGQLAISEGHANRRIALGNNRYTTNSFHQLAGANGGMDWSVAWEQRTDLWVFAIDQQGGGAAVGAFEAHHFAVFAQSELQFTGV